MSVCHGSLIREIMNMKNRMDFLYRETVQATQTDRDETQGDREWEPLADILEDDQEWVAVVDLPGVLESDLSVELRDHTLILTGRRWHLPVTGKRLLECRRPQGPFKKEWPLSENIERDRVSADYRNGVLTIVVPKKPVPSRKVPVRAEV